MYFETIEIDEAYFFLNNYLKNLLHSMILNFVNATINEYISLFLKQSVYYIITEILNEYYNDRSKVCYTRRASNHKINT